MNSDVRREAERLHRALCQPHARCTVGQGRWLADKLMWALTAVRSLDASLRQEQELYATLAADWNALIAVLAEERGITVIQPMGGTWVWRVGDASGSAPTIAEAYRAALQHLAGGERGL